VRIIINYEVGGTWKEQDMTYFKEWLRKILKARQDKRVLR
jgi:hypothetical protein